MIVWNVTVQKLKRKLTSPNPRCYSDWLNLQQRVRLAGPRLPPFHLSCAVFCCKIDSISVSSATCATCSNCNRASCWTSSDIHKGQWLNLLGAERFDCRIVSKLCICDFFLDNSSETSANFLTVLDTSSCCSLPTSWSFWMIFAASSR